MTPKLISIAAAARRARLALLGALAALMFAAAGCSDAASPDSPSLRFTVDNASGFDPSSENGAEASVAGSYGVIVVAGRITLPSPCYELSPRVQRSGANIDVTIRATDTLQPCPAVVTVRGYSLRIGDLSAGVYLVRLVHEVSGMPQVQVLARHVTVE